MKELKERAVRAYYGYDIETYQRCLADMETRLQNESCACRKCALQDEYMLVRSLAFLNMPAKLCEFYGEAAARGVKTDIFDFSETFLLAWAYDDLIEYFGMPTEKGEAVAQRLEQAIALHARFSDAARGTDLLYRAELALRKGEYEKALYHAREAERILPERSKPALACARRIAKSAYERICVQ